MGAARLRLNPTPRPKLISPSDAIAYGRGMKFAALSLFLALTPPALAMTQDEVLTATLLPGWRMENGHQMAALSLTLAPGWKTYWRSPGEAGIPPLFDWSGSDNIASVRLHWPSPSVFHTNGMQTVGYHDRLVLPVEITPIDPARPITVRLQVDLGVCSDICMPAALSLAGELPAKGTPDAAIRAALGERPRSGREAGLRDIACRIEPIRDGLRLTADIDLPRRGRDEVVVFESAGSRVWVSEAVTERQGGRLVSTADLVGPGGAPFALDRKGVTVTVLGDGPAVEIAGCPAP